MRIELRGIDEIRPYELNPRLNDQAVDAVAGSLREFGFRQPIVVDEAGVIIIGHTRWKAAKKLGLAKVPVHVAKDLSPEQATAYRLADRQYARRIARFKKVHTRVSLKAGTPEAFTQKTGAKPESFALPFEAIANLLEAGASFHVAAMVADHRIVSNRERESLLDRLASIDPLLVRHLEEEVVDPYHTTRERLRHAGVKLTWD